MPIFTTYRSLTVTEGLGNRPSTYVKRSWGHQDSLNENTYVYHIEWKNFEYFVKYICELFFEKQQNRDSNKLFNK